MNWKDIFIDEFNGDIKLQINQTFVPHHQESFRRSGLITTLPCKISITGRSQISPLSFIWSINLSLSNYICYQYIDTSTIDTLPFFSWDCLVPFSLKSFVHSVSSDSLVSLVPLFELCLFPWHQDFGVGGSSSVVDQLWPQSPPPTSPTTTRTPTKTFTTFSRWT